MARSFMKLAKSHMIMIYMIMIYLYDIYFNIITIIINRKYN